MSGTQADGAAVKGSAPWGSGGHNELPSGRPYVWRRGRRHQAAPPQTRGPVVAGDGQEPGDSCKRCGYLTTARATDCPYIWNAHAALGRQAGLRDALVNALRRTLAFDGSTMEANSTRPRK